MSVKGFLDDHYEKCRQKFYSHVRPWIVIGVEMAKATGWRMSYDEYRALIDFLGGMNSYERKVLLPALDDLAICELTQSCLDQFRTLGELDVATTYDEAVQRELAPLLVKRLRESQQHNDAFCEGMEYAERNPGAQYPHPAGTANVGWWLRGHESVAHRKTIRRQKNLIDQAVAKYEGACVALDTARRQAATWEIQAQDLRDQLIQVKSELAAVKAAEPACTGCGFPMETTLCWECAR